MGILDALRDPQFRQDVKTNASNFGQSASNALAGNVSAPLDIIAWALRKAGIPVPEPVGGSQWMAERGLTREVPDGAPKLAGEAFGLIAPLAGAPQNAAAIARGLRQMGDNMAAPRTMNPQTGAIVWHGSPHKFDKFDASKIGTGEGSQAYGHGLYLAEAPDVAKNYAENLSLRAPQQNRTQILAEIKRVKDTVQGPRRGQLLKQLNDDLAFIKSGAGSEGQIYKVELPDEQIARMLDWDKPLSAQPKQLQSALAKIDPDMYSPKGADYDPTELGQMIYQRLAQKGQDAAAMSMRQQGIPGIRYLDGGSRSAGQGSSNFVVFPGNENMLKIVERNGQPLGLIGDMNRPGRYAGQPIVNASSPFDQLPYHAMREELASSGTKMTLAERTAKSIDERLARQSFDDEIRAAYQEIYGAIPSNVSIEEIAAKVRPHVFKATQEAQQSGNPFYKAFSNSGKYIGNQ